MPKLHIIKEILEQRNIPMADFCKEINMSVAGFKGILERNSTRIQTLEVIAQALNCPVGIFFDEPKQEKNSKKTILKPHIPISAQAGSLSGYSEGVTEAGCEMNNVISAFGSYDFTIDVKGDSMNDEYRSGDVVACKHVNPGESIWFGRVFVLDTAQGVIMKQVERCKEDPSLIRCISFNKEYAPFEISLSDVYGMSLVVGVIKSV
ncbi:MAG: S24 family peptidase [Bacteroidales bacterium]